MADDLKITLGRKEFAVPEFTWAEQKKLAPLMARWSRIDFANLSDPDMTALGDLLALTVCRGDGAPKREDLEKLPISMQEIVDAVPVIAQAARMRSGKDPAAGEGQAASS
jgi:hypothetical protein